MPYPDDGAIEHTGKGVEADLPGDAAAQFFGQLLPLSTTSSV
jgi:hypothetical protein